MANKKETDYFEYFRKSAEYASRAANYLDEILKSFNKASVPQQVEKMHEIEHAADANRHDMITALAKEFIPPIEREDIVSLAQELDNVVDTIDEFVQSLYMYDVSEIRPEALAFSELVIRCCDALLEAATEFRGFRKSKTLKDMLIRVNSIESEGDVLFTNSVHTLFVENVDPKTLFVWMKLFEALEDCFDACEDAVDIIESVIMKNS
jgi:uncharacterized protein Yka (UPF0111/DUF47 family)